jgi:hypothetical protein
MMRNTASLRMYQAITDPDEGPTELVKQPQSISSPLAILKTRAAKNTASRKLHVKTAPGRNKPRIRRSPMPNSTQGRRMEVRLTSALGRI